MLSIGIQPDILLCRHDQHIPGELTKILRVPATSWILLCSMEDVDTITRCHAELRRKDWMPQILRLLKLEARPSDLSRG